MDVGMFLKHEGIHSLECVIKPRIPCSEYVKNNI